MGKPSKKDSGSPHLTICGRCGKDLETRILTGDDKLYQCTKCRLKTVGRAKGNTCPKCFTAGMTCLGDSDPHMKLVAGFCDTCEAERAAIEEEYKKGGVPWRCKDCESTGVIKHDSDFAVNYRKEHAVNGIKVGKKDCPVCQKRAEENSLEKTKLREIVASGDHTKPVVRSSDS